MRMQQVFDAAVDRFQKGFYHPGDCYSCVLGTLVNQGLITTDEWCTSIAERYGEFGKLLKQLETVYEVWTTQFIDRGIPLLNASDVYIGFWEVSNWNLEQQVEWYNSYLKQIAKLHGLEFKLPSKEIKSKLVHIDTILEAV